MKLKQLTATLCVIAMLAGCAHPSQNRYGAADVGMNSVVQFGTIISQRPVDIIGNNSGAGATVGMVAGAAGGSAIGSGDGSVAGLLAGMVIGAVVGAAAEQAMQDRTGIEYVITLEDGKTESIVQNIAKDDVPLRVGQRVMVQTSGTYRRVLPADALPEEVEKPKGIKVVERGR